MVWKFDCRWSWMNIFLSDRFFLVLNIFRIRKTAIGVVSDQSSYQSVVHFFIYIYCIQTSPSNNFKFWDLKVTSRPRPIQTYFSRVFRHFLDLMFMCGHLAVKSAWTHIFITGIYNIYLWKDNQIKKKFHWHLCSNWDSANL